MKKTGIKLISQEPKEQILKHFRFTGSISKDEYPLLESVRILCMSGKDRLIQNIPNGWDRDYFKTMTEKPYKDRLIIAGVLIAAEIDKIQAIENFEEKMIENRMYRKGQSETIEIHEVSESFDEKADRLRSTDGGH